MKLYTEEQVTELTTAAFTAGQNHNPAIFGVAFEKITPIELPSDEEIEEYFKHGWGSDYHGSYAIFGAKWLKDKIQGGNK
jgi:hypothetical protein